MIEELTFRGYRTFGVLESFRMKPLNVLIGPNMSGKTNFIEFFEFIGAAAGGELQKFFSAHGGTNSLFYRRGRIEPITEVSLSFRMASLPEGHDQWRGKFAFSIGARNYSPVVESETIDAEVDGEKLTLRNNKGKVAFNFPWMEINSEFALTDAELALSYARDRYHYPVVFSLRENPSSIEVHYAAVVTHDPRLSVRRPARVGEGTTLTRDMSNLSAILHDLYTRPDRKGVWEDLVGFMRLAYPNLGLLRLLGLLVILLDPSPPPLVCIDEPEIGLHPSLLPEIGRLLKDLSERTQVVVATHSPDLLDGIESPEDVVVVERGEDGDTQLKRPDAEELGPWIESYKLGRLYRNGKIGGMP